MKPAGGEIHMSVGPLQCTGQGELQKHGCIKFSRVIFAILSFFKQFLNHFFLNSANIAITILHEDDYIILPPWNGSDVDITFRTDKANGTLLYQHSDPSLRNDIPQMLVQLVRGEAISKSKTYIYYTNSHIHYSVLSDYQVKFNNACSAISLCTTFSGTSIVF